MKGRITILTVFLIGLETLCFGQNENVPALDINPNSHPISRFIISDETQEKGLKSVNDFEVYDDLIRKLEVIRGRKRSEKAFLRSIFYRVHKKLLINYSKQATMSETMATGNFGCLTGTAIYALVLSHFNYDYEIIELPNHVFIKMKLNGQDLIVESTDPESGLKSISKELAQSMEQIGFDPRKLPMLTTVGEGSVDEWDLFEGHVKINLQELAGLQYFNESVRYYIQEEYVKSMEMISAAYERYPSKRNEKLMQLVINKILKYDQIKEELKNKYLKQYITRVKKQKISQTK
ncbi:hypothetical protein [Roseivirga misakiensis]|uniref:Protein SirB1 N-terminal domain-containing protein n=1 Tax=Roseivirga misakiensis TaxID=1563681 RepID=A0A1E5T7T9_9BACT|nr:hypothetical protein [Roseivirga misakiensis]OEK07451.1 hypothetical protein BFP71_00135 [Roseivirga misakiensis]